MKQAESDLSRDIMYSTEINKLGLVTQITTQII